jgi:hypothetical protein
MPVDLNQREGFEMKKVLLLASMLFLLIVTSQSAMALMSFSGSLSTPDGIFATEPWMTEGMIINWEINQNADMTWDYRYTFRDYAGAAPRKAISHMVVAISPNATLADFWGANGPLEIQTWDGSDPSNPGMPGSLYGLKIDISDDEYFFTSTKAPVWGDFYIKDGTLDQNPIYAYNTTFGTPDPDDPPMNGSLNYKILRPDSTSIPVPEPSTLLLFGSALALAGGVRKFRRK